LGCDLADQIQCVISTLLTGLGRRLCCCHEPEGQRKDSNVMIFVPASPFFQEFLTILAVWGQGVIYS
jgi:hypothetical protein